MSAATYTPVQQPSHFPTGSTRTPTVVDDAARGLKPIVLPPASPSYGDAGQKKSNTMLIGVGSVLLLVALGGGAWALFHRPAEATEETSVNRPSIESQPTGGASETPASAPSAAQTGKPGTGVNAGPAAQSGTSTGPAPDRRQPNANPAGSTGIPNPAPQSKTPAQYVPPIALPKTKPANPASGQEKIVPATASSGTLAWTGTIAGNPQVIIIRSSDSASQGQLSGPMFPAQPVKLSVRPPGSAVVFAAPEARTNYNSLQLYVRGVGQQTIYIDWVTQ